MNDRTRDTGSGKSVAVVVPVHNRLELTKRFLQSFAKIEYPTFKFVIIDDGSTDGTADWLEQNYPLAVVLRGNGDLWWTGGTNVGVRYAIEHDFDFVLTINNDSIVEPTFLTCLVETAGTLPKTIVGSCLLQLADPEYLWCLGGTMDWKKGRPFRHKHSLEPKSTTERLSQPFHTEVLTGCGTLVPTEVFRTVGLYDGRWFPQYHADSELVLRARRYGYDSVVDLHAVVYNDVKATWQRRSWSEVFFSRRSPYYWRPILMAHFRYCPWWLIPISIIRLYGGTIYCLWRQSASSERDGVVA